MVKSTDRSLLQKAQAQFPALTTACKSWLSWAYNLKINHKKYLPFLNNLCLIKIIMALKLIRCLMHLHYHIRHLLSIHYLIFTIFLYFFTNSSIFLPTKAIRRMITFVGSNKYAQPTCFFPPHSTEFYGYSLNAQSSHTWPPRHHRKKWRP